MALMFLAILLSSAKGATVPLALSTGALSGVGTHSNGSGAVRNAGAPSSGTSDVVHLPLVASMMEAPVPLALLLPSPALWCSLWCLLKSVP